MALELGGLWFKPPQLRSFLFIYQYNNFEIICIFVITERFFVPVLNTSSYDVFNYTNQGIRFNKFSVMRKLIANFLKLTKLEYILNIGISSATLLADSGGDIISLMGYGGWK